jgi:hypothetical protein
MRLASLLGVAAAAGVASAAGMGAVTPVTVKITDTRLALSRQTAVAGTVVFAVANLGRKPHAFSIAGHSTRRLPPGGHATLKVTFAVPGPYSYSYSYLGSTLGVLHIVAPAPALTTTPSVSGSSTPATLSVAGPGPCTNPTATTVKVTMTDVAANGGFTFSPAPIPCGTVTFILFNAGQLAHGLQLVDPNGNPLPAGPAVASTQYITLTLTLDVAGEYEWKDSQDQGTTTDFGYVYVG